MGSLGRLLSGRLAFPVLALCVVAVIALALYTDNSWLLALVLLVAALDYVLVSVIRLWARATGDPTPAFARREYRPERKTAADDEEASEDRRIDLLLGIAPKWTMERDLTFLAVALFAGVVLGYTQQLLGFGITTAVLLIFGMLVLGWAAAEFLVERGRGIVRATGLLGIAAVLIVKFGAGVIT